MKLFPGIPLPANNGLVGMNIRASQRINSGINGLTKVKPVLSYCLGGNSLVVNYRQVEA